MKRFLMTLAATLAVLAFSSSDLLAKKPGGGGGHGPKGGPRHGRHHPGGHAHKPHHPANHAHHHGQPHKPHGHHMANGKHHHPHHPVAIRPVAPVSPYRPASPYQPVSPYNPVEIVTNPGVIPAPVVVNPTTPVVLNSTSAPVVDAPAATPASAEATENEETEESTTQFLRQLRVSNNSGEKVTVHLQYCTLNDDESEIWLPADPKESTKDLSFTLEPGQTTVVKDEDTNIAANRVRFWVQGKSGTWKEFRNQDLWLVPEKDADGDHSYEADDMETYTVSIKPLRG